MTYTPASLYYLIAAIAIIVGCFVLIGLRNPRFQAYKEARLPLVNTAVATTVALILLQLIAQQLSETEYAPLVWLSQGAWILALVLTILNSGLPNSIIAVSLLVGAGAPALTTALSLNWADMFQQIDLFLTPPSNSMVRGQEDSATSVAASDLLRALYYFTNIFFISNYYGRIVRVRNQMLGRLGETSSFRADVLNNTIAFLTSGTSILLSLALVGADVRVLGVLSAIATAGIIAILRDVIADVASGILLILHKDINEKDVLEIRELGTGTVQKITLRHTVIMDRNDISVLVPNSLLLKQPIKHLTYNGRETRLTVDIGVGYDVDLPRAIAIMESVGYHIERVLVHPKPTVQVRGSNAYDITLRLCFWVDTPDRGLGNVKSEVYYYLISEFSEKGIVIPYPILEIRRHIRKNVPDNLASKSANSGDAQLAGE